MDFAELWKHGAAGGQQYEDYFMERNSSAVSKFKKSPPDIDISDKHEKMVWLIVIQHQGGTGGACGRMALPKLGVRA